MFTYSRLRQVGCLFAISLTGAVVCPQAEALERPRPGEIEQLRKTNQLQTRLAAARALGNHRIDVHRLRAAIVRAARQELSRQGRIPAEIDRLAPEMAPPPGQMGMPSTGSVKVLAVLIEFTDYIHTNCAADINGRLFGAGDAAAAPYDSLTNYYKRASYGKLNLSGVTLGWYQKGVKRAAISQTPAARDALIKEVLNHYDSQGHNFRQYDNNGDGVLDYLIVIWTGPDNGWANFWLAYQTRFSDPTYTMDGIRLDRYSWQWEAHPVGSAFSPVVVTHETGHALGLPDYYDYDDSVGPMGGVGGLDMMDANKGDHGCFNKWVLDWLTPKIISAGTHTETLRATGTSPDCVVIWPGISSGDVFSEFYAVQNRHRVGNDNAPGMPSDGILIWHVDAHLDSSGQNFRYDNSFTEHKLVRLMEADGLEEIEKGLGADADDYWRTGKLFGPLTTPSSKKYDGTDSGVEVSNFSAPGPQMTAVFKVAGLQVLAGAIWRYTGSPCTGDSCPGWQQLDNNQATREIAVSAGHVYQRQSNGTVWRFVGPECTGNSCPGWQRLDNNPQSKSLSAGGFN